MSSIDTTIPVSEVLVDGVSVPLVGGGSGVNKLAQLIDGTITELTAEDLKGTTKIKQYAFYSCRSLTSIEIPASVTTIDSYAFQYCVSLTSITIPDSITSLKSGVFAACSKLAAVTIKATTPPSLSSTSAIPDNVTTIYIPTGTLSAYSTATNWSSFASKFVEKEMT